MNKTKIAIIGTKLMVWGGGIDFLIDFIKILERHPEKYSFEVYLPYENCIDRLIRRIFKIERDSKRIRERLKEECPDIPIVFYLDRIFNKKKRYSSIKKISLKRKIDVLMPMDSLMHNIVDDKYITVAYIYDFQHKYLPELFSRKELDFRDKYFPQMLTAYDFAFTQSFDTKKDIEKYYGKLSDNVYVMYAYPCKLETAIIDGEKLFSKYGINSFYFIVCNQFWAHKNHSIVFEALEKLYNAGQKNIMVVCTGDTSDYRAPHYFDNLNERISRMNCKNNIRILGYIDKSDQIYLLKHSIALIQPTLFEGNPGGGSVVDAMGYGVPCVVSNIPVNLEIPHCFGIDDVSFFPPHDVDKLVEIMDEKIKSYNPNIEYKNTLNYEQYYELYDNAISDMKSKKWIHNIN